MTRSVRCFGFLTVAVLLALAHSAPADAAGGPELKASDPAAQAVLATPPSEIVLTFSTAVEPAFSFVAVLDGNGRRIDVGHMERDKTRANVVHVSLFGKAQGECLVNWRMVGKAGGNGSGRYTFSIVP